MIAQEEQLRFELWNHFPWLNLRYISGHRRREERKTARENKQQRERERERRTLLLVCQGTSEEFLQSGAHCWIWRISIWPKHWLKSKRIDPHFVPCEILSVSAFEGSFSRNSNILTDENLSNL
jgi:hypothetical protein